MIWIYVLLFLITILFCEIVSYLFHRYLFIKTVISTSIREEHRIHHQSNDNAVHDYLVMLLVMLCVSLLLLVLLPYYPTIVLYILLLTVVYFAINWYIHCSYHNENNFLHDYKPFQYLYNFHMQHHSNPQCNYGIVTPLADYLFATYQSPGKE